MGARPHLVIDTNVWVSLILWQSPMLAAVLDRAVTQFQVIGSRETLAELQATLGKPKFAAKISATERQLVFEVVIKATKLVDAVESVTDCRDPSDNKFLELAISGGAMNIITGDNDLLVLHPWRGVSILTPRQFVEATGLPPV